MALGILEQIKTQIDQANHILVCFRPQIDSDAITSALSLGTFLELSEKKVDMVSQNFTTPKRLQFLPKQECILPQLPFLQKLVITIDIKDEGIEAINYDVEKDKLRIYITPESGIISPKNITTAQTQYKYDLIITIGAPDLLSLGEVYTKNTELFFQVPVINIDYRPENEHFGHINYTDVTIPSTSEMVYSIIKHINPHLMNTEIATCLLTGIIENTKSFQSSNTKPQTLSLASELITLGAKRDFIIQSLYQTKNLNTLKLWGQALSHMEYDKENKFVWTSITRDDYSRTGTNTEELPAIFNELIDNSPETEVALILSENNGIQAFLSVQHPYHAKDMLQSFENVQGD
ncbi:MAG: DHH family phosphoesterase, partial [Candidatus Magasanikbacteria bacterium]